MAEIDDPVRQAPRAGLAALLQVAGIEPEQVTAERISFTLAPRLNAAGRLGRADVAVQLLMTDDEIQAETLAEELCRLNRERQELVSRGAQLAFPIHDGIPVMLVSEARPLE